jgi:hypothetical protein
LETIPTANHMLRDIIFCQHGWLSSFANIGQNDFMLSNMVERTTQSSTNCFHMELCSNCSTEAATAAHIITQDIGQQLQRKSFIFPSEKTRFP